MKGTDSTREQLKKHNSQLAAVILLSLRKKQKKREDQEFVRSQEEFFDCFPAMPLSPPDYDECYSIEECDMMIYGHQIDLPQNMTPLPYEEAPMEFTWFDSQSLPDEVFLMPLNSFDVNINNK